MSSVPADAEGRVSDCTTATGINGGHDGNRNLGHGALPTL
jgi:hypothetical protein